MHGGIIHFKPRPPEKGHENQDCNSNLFWLILMASLQRSELGVNYASVLVSVVPSSRKLKAMCFATVTGILDNDDCN